MKLDEVLSGLGLKLNPGALTMDKVVHVLLLILVGVVVIRVVLKLLDRVLARSKSLKSLSRYIHSVAKISMAVILVLMVAEDVGIHTTSLVAMLSVAGLAVSLALQGGLSNFAGGVMILLLKPFKVGDYIIFPGEGQEGTVKKIEMYYTTINSIDNRTIMIPNANLTNHTIINVTAMDRRKLEIKVGISYESDIRKAKDILRRLVEEEPHFQSEEQQFFVDELGESAITVGLRAWVATENYWPVKWKMNERIKEEFDAAGISIPYNQLDVHICPEPANKKAGKGDK
mgnify:CR=1 FL=1